MTDDRKELHSIYKKESERDLITGLIKETVLEVKHENPKECERLFKENWRS